MTTLRISGFVLLLLVSVPHLALAAGPMSAAFNRFKYSFFDDPTSAQDGLDISSLNALVGEERGKAEAMLLALLPDSRAVIGLGVLRSHKAEPALARLFNAERAHQLEARNDPSMRPGGSSEWYPSGILYLAQALWRIHPDPRWPQAAIEVLSSAREWVFRQEAIEALDGVNEPIAVQALASALDDTEPLVRHDAACGLLKLHGLPAESTDPQALTYRVMSSDDARHEAAKQEILAAIAGRPAIAQ